MSQIPRVSHGFLDRRNPNQVDPAWYVFLQQVATSINGIPAAIDSSGKQNYSALLSAISEQTGSGFLVLQGGSGAVVRQLGEGDGISITNPSGGAGNPVISLEDLADSGLGDDGVVALTRDDKGRIAGMRPATAEDLAFDDTVHGLALVNVQAAIDRALGALPYFSDTAPDPDVHPFWIDTTDLSPYVWYDDGTSAQWIALDALASLAASAVTYDNTTSGLTATNVQDAIDEIAASGGGAGITDGDKGDITVSGSGTVWEIDAGVVGTPELANDAVTYAKMQNVSATARIIGRKTAGAGDPEEMTLSETLDLIGSAAQGDILYRGSSGWARLPAGTSGYFLKTLGAGANPAWDSAGGGGGAMTYVATSTVAGSDATSVTFSSLDLGTDIEYYIQVVLKNPSAATRTYSLFFNGDTTATNYQRQALNGGGSSATAGNSNDGILFSANASGTATGFIRISKDVDGKARAFSCVSRDAGTSLRLEMTVHQQITASNVTSITIQGSAASMIAIGSTFRLYKVKP